MVYALEDGKSSEVLFTCAQNLGSVGNPSLVILDFSAQLQWSLSTPLLRRDNKTEILFTLHRLERVHSTLGKNRPLRGCS